eukprot:INCI16405.1.p1 GENE.INCI16405.1~~INCI16405.1.p1  ORF type:complete len:771 (-),score=107.33 INCI16405.1:2079-4391(-)
MKRHWSSRSACAAVIFLSVLACVSPRTVSARIDPAIGDRIVELTTESDVRGLLATPSRWIDNNNRDGRSMTTTLLVLHKSGSLFAGATSASDSHEAGSNGSRAAVSTSHSSGQDLRPFLNALSEAMEQMRPLRKGSPFVEVSFLDSQAAPAAARALGQHVVSQQHHLGGACVECVTRGTNILAFVDGKIFGVYPDSGELLSCSCSCGKDVLCPDNPCCSSEIDAGCTTAQVASCLNDSSVSSQPQDDNAWRAKFCWPPSCSQPRAASLLLRWLASAESHHARATHALFAPDGSLKTGKSIDLKSAGILARVLRLTATEKKLALDLFVAQMRDGAFGHIDAPAERGADPPISSGRGSGRGIVVPAGGAFLLTNTWLALRNLRRTGCTLPVEVWFNGNEEMPEATKAAFERDIEGVVCRNIKDYIHHPSMARFFDKDNLALAAVQRFEIKPFAALFSHFREILLLDSDNVPIRDPTFLFDHDAFQTTGAIFWPDYRELDTSSEIFDVFGVARPSHGAVEQDSGELIVDKGSEAGWIALNVLCYVASGGRSAYYFKKYWGDKEYWHLSWRRAAAPFHFIGHYPGSVAPNASDVRSPTGFCGGSMLHYDPDGQPLFMHCTLTERSPVPKFDRRWGVLKERSRSSDSTTAMPQSWADEIWWTTRLLEGGKAKEAYYATHDFRRRLICVDIPDPVSSTTLCDHDSTAGEQLADSQAGALCSTETALMRDLKGLQSLGGEEFMDTPWYTELVLGDKTYSYAVDLWAQPEDTETQHEL